jgi:peptidoglycan/LPS O-acetylase OafA/YrhL
MTEAEGLTRVKSARSDSTELSTIRQASPAPPSSARIPQLDGLRGMAILLVLLYHYVFLASPTPRSSILHYLQAAFRMGWAGVDLFFVLSGFLIGGILLDARDSPRYFKTFYLRRIHRIFPIYYLWIGTYFLVAFTPLIRWAGPIGIVRGKWTIIAAYGLFLQNVAWSRGDAFRTAWLAALWSLAVEEQFYLAMPSIVRFLSRRGLVKLLISVIIGAPLIRILVYKYIVPTHGSAPYVLTPCRADALAMGVLLALVLRQERSRAFLQGHLKMIYGVLGLLLLGVLYLALVAYSQYSYAMTVWGYSCLDASFSGLLVLALITPGGIWAGICRSPFLIEIGGISYCMYIIHTAVNSICHFAFSSPLNGISTLRSLAATVVAAGLTWLVAKLSWRYLESPMIRLGHRYKY